MTPDRPFSFYIGDNRVVVKPDPEAEGKSLLIIGGELYHADFRVKETALRVEGGSEFPKDRA